MPNHITTRIVAENFEALKQALINENNEVDFNKVIPLSPDLDITAGSIEYESRLQYYPKEERLAFQVQVLDPFLHQFYNDTISQTEFTELAYKELRKAKNKTLWQRVKEAYKIPDKRESEFKNAIKGYYNVQKHGYPNWYIAHNNEWGTKWNAYETEIIGKEVRFKTAWNTPLPVLLKLSEVTPLAVAYADEDTGSNFGVIAIKNGEITTEFSPNPEQLNIAARVGMALAIMENNINEFFDDYTEEEFTECFNQSKTEFIQAASKVFYETKKLLTAGGFAV